MKHLYYILILTIGTISCDSAPQKNNIVEDSNAKSLVNEEVNKFNYQADTLRYFKISIDSINVYSIIRDFKIPDSIAADSTELSKFKPYLFNKIKPNARFMKRLKIDDRSELVLIHENIFHDNFIYGFIINLSDQTISDNLLLAGRLNFEGSKTIESSAFQLKNGSLEIDQILKECFDCADVGSNYPVLICDSCYTKSTLIHFDRFYRKIMTKPNKK